MSPRPYQRSVTPGSVRSAECLRDDLLDEDPVVRAEACEELPTIRFDKELVDVTEQGGGQWEVSYDLTVENTGDVDTTYDLSDTLRFGAGITVVDASVGNTAPGGIVTNVHRSLLIRTHRPGR